MQLMAAFLMDFAEKLLQTSSDTPKGMNFLMLSINFLGTEEFFYGVHLWKNLLIYLMLAGVTTKPIFQSKIAGHGMIPTDSIIVFMGHHGHGLCSICLDINPASINTSEK